MVVVFNDSGGLKMITEVVVLKAREQVVCDCQSDHNLR